MIEKVVQKEYNMSSRQVVFVSHFLVDRSRTFDTLKTFRSLDFRFPVTRKIMMGRPRPKPRRPKSFPYPAARRSFIFSSTLGLSSPTLTFAPTTNFADLKSASSSASAKIQKWIDRIGEHEWYWRCTCLRGQAPKQWPDSLTSALKSGLDLIKVILAQIYTLSNFIPSDWLRKVIWSFYSSQIGKNFGRLLLYAKIVL